MICLAAIIAAGILSRMVHTGFQAFDKYLGDVLYAAMFYAILRLACSTVPRGRLALYAMAAMTAIELFQLTGIAVRLLASEHLLVRICARLMGTQFSFVDLVCYAVGIGVIFLADSGAHPTDDRGAVSFR